MPPLRTALHFALTAGLAAGGLGGCVDPPHADAGAGKPRQADAPARVATAPSNGYGEQIAWRGLDEGLAEAAELGRPLLLLVHASWCGRCKELKPKFSEPELLELSEQFVMVNVDQDEVPRALEFGPDGTYVPRVLFVDPRTARPDAELSNTRRGRTIYYYSPQDDLVGTMKKALSRHAG